MNIRLRETALFQAEGWTDRQTDYRPTYTYDEANSRFSQFFDLSYKFLCYFSACYNDTCLKNVVQQNHTAR